MSSNHLDEMTPLKSVWDKLESISKITSAIAVPVVIALGGWWIQDSIMQQSIGKDYVALAVSVLEKPKAEVDQGLRDWAVDILDDYAPRRFSPDTIARLKKGSASLPGSIFLGDSAIVVPMPDGQLAAFDVHTGKLLWTYVPPSSVLRHELPK